MNRMLRWVAGAALSVCAVPVVSATPIITVGDLALAPNTAGQVRDITVSGGDAVIAETFDIQIGTGSGTGAVAGAPKITAVSIVAADTIFGGNNNGQGGSGKLSDQLWDTTTATNSGSVATSGTLAHVTFDTTGVTQGNWVLRVKPTSAGDTEFTNSVGGTVAPSVVNGTVSVPEPGMIGLAGAVVCGGLLRARGRRR